MKAPPRLVESDTSWNISSNLSQLFLHCDVKNIGSLAFWRESRYIYNSKNVEVNDLTKVELVNAVAEKSGLTKKDSEKAVTAMLDGITGALANGDSVSIVGFGTFEVKSRAARIGVNPRTKEPLQIAASSLPTFRAGKSLKEAVSK